MIVALVFVIFGCEFPYGFLIATLISNSVVWRFFIVFIVIWLDIILLW